jgi:hypothetical protein
VPIRTVVATAQGQGQRRNDFAHATEGELVIFPLVCDRDMANPDGGCGCNRSFEGVESRKATTTAVVADVDLTYSEYVDAILASQHRFGLTNHSRADAGKEADELLDMFKDWPVGTVVEKRGARVQQRHIVRPAISVPLPDAGGTPR